MSSDTAAEKAARRKAALQKKKDAEKEASEKLGKKIKLVVVKPKKKIGKKNGQAHGKKKIAKFNVTVDLKTLEAIIKPHKSSYKKKQKAAADSASDGEKNSA